MLHMGWRRESTQRTNNIHDCTVRGPWGTGPWTQPQARYLGAALDLGVGAMHVCHLELAVFLLVLHAHADRVTVYGCHLTAQP
jgi:hypothetical protein